MKPPPFRMRQETEYEKWRAETFWTKEPETRAWIRSFRNDSAFLDIGANVGIYSLYAGKRGVRTLALEPHPGNFMSLVINQRFMNRGLPVRPLLGSAGNKNEMRNFYFTTASSGSTGGSHTKKRSQCQYVRMYAVAFMMENYGPFDHVKIDVDGGEAAIVIGMKNALAEGQIESCLIEVEPDSKHIIVNRFTECGYTMDNQFNTMTPHSRERRAQEGIDVENIIFTRL